MSEDEQVMKSLLGLGENEERLWFIELGKTEALNSFRMYFKQKEEALAMFSAISGFNFKIAQNEYLSWKDYSKTQIFYWLSSGEILLGSEVMEIYPNKKVALEARLKLKAKIEEEEEANGRDIGDAPAPETEEEIDPEELAKAEKPQPLPKEVTKVDDSK